MAKKWNYKYQLYKHLQANTQAIYAEARKAGEEIGITEEWKNNIGLTGAVSGCHGLLVREVSQAMDDAARKVIPSAALDEKIRDIIKSVYGDAYDAALVNTCEGALNLSYDVLCMPPLTGRGDNYRARYMAPLERHLHHQGAYGRPFPPKYKEINAERGEAAGEYGMAGKRANNLDTIFVKMAGANYECHGIKYNPCPNLLHADGQKTVEQFETVAARHEELLRDRLAGLRHPWIRISRYSFFFPGSPRWATTPRDTGTATRTPITFRCCRKAWRSWPRSTTFPTSSITPGARRLSGRISASWARISSCTAWTRPPAPRPAA